MSLQNHYHRRLTAASSAKACFICYKPTPTVLITPDSRDFFYVCAGHLEDRGFAVAVDEEGKDKEKEQRDQALKQEVEKVKREYKEKMKKKAEKGKGKAKNANDAKDKQDKEVKKEDDGKEEKERDDKIKALETKKDGGEDKSNGNKLDGPRVYTLHKYVNTLGSYEGKRRH